MHIFKYHPDNVIYINGVKTHTFEEFTQSYPSIQLMEGQYLEYSDDGLDLINSLGHHFPQDLSLFEGFIKSIGGICGIRE